MKQVRTLPPRVSGWPRRAGLEGPGLEEGRADVADVSIRYLEAGQQNAGLPILMLHGLQTGADLWFPHPFPSLASTFHLIAPDLPGFGDSAPISEYSTSRYAEVMFGFMQRLGYERFDLMGHSMGAQIAVAMAATHPERVNRLLLIDAAGLPQERPVWLQPVRMIGDASMRHVKLYPTVFRLTLKSRALRECIKMVQEEDISDLLEKVTVPTLVVWGSRDRLTPLEHGAYMGKRIPNARLAIIRGAGHMPFYQKPEQFIRLARGFFSKG